MNDIIVTMIDSERRIFSSLEIIKRIQYSTYDLYNYGE